MRKTLLFAGLFLALVVSGAEAPKAPGEAELKPLVRDSLLAFNKAVQAKDFGGFYKQISAVWRKQITPEKLKEIFQSFIDQRMNIAFVSTVEPAFINPPAIDPDGVLTVEGFYLAPPSKAEFRLKYLKEKSAWKLIGIKVDVKPSGSADVELPDEKQCKALVKQSLFAFNKAIQAKSFGEFHKGIAAVWQAQTTPEKLQKLFQKFIDAEVDLSPIGGLEPVFDPEPALNTDSILQMKGVYPTKPSHVAFDLGYVYEAPDWKLIKINVKVARGDDEPETTPEE